MNALLKFKRAQGAVLVTLKKVSNLPAADGNGTSDPYVRFELDDHKRTSSVQQKTLNGSWNEKFEWLYVRPRHRPCLHMDCTFVTWHYPLSCQKICMHAVPPACTVSWLDCVCQTLGVRYFMEFTTICAPLALSCYSGIQT